MNESERKAAEYDVAGWIWGVVKGGFSEQQTIGQIVLDALIGMIPVVGDVTAARDLIAVILRLSEHPEKRKEKLEWLTLVLLLFALVPVVGGIIKGVGRSLLKVSAGAGKNAAVLREMIELLNRLGRGHAVKFLQELTLEKYIPELLGRWRALMQRLDLVLDAVLRKMRSLMTDGMIQRLEQLRRLFAELQRVGESMIPEAVKELHRRLKEVQHLLYEGEWHAVRSAAAGKTRSVTREAEARLVTTVDAKGNTVKGWETKEVHFPASTEKDYDEVFGWPDLGSGKYLDRKTGAPWAVSAFSGPIRPVKLAPGTTIYRIIAAPGSASGLWWTYKLPKDGRVWRENWAVLESWNTNGLFVEFVVPEPGILAWEGRVASQIENDASKVTLGQYLKGGDTQLLIDFQFPANHAAAAHLPAPKPTHWSANSLSNVNVPSRALAVLRLGEHEIEPKVIERTAAAARVAQRLGRAYSQQPPDSGRAGENR